MYTDNVSGVCKKFWTKNLSELSQKEGSAPVKTNGKGESYVDFAGTFESFGVDKKPELYSAEEVAKAIEEIRAKDKYPSDTDIIAFANERAKQAARQKAMLKAVTDAGFIQPTLKEDIGLRVAKFKAILKGSYEDLDDATLTLMAEQMVKAADERVKASQAQTETEESEG